MGTSSTSAKDNDARRPTVQVLAEATGVFMLLVAVDDPQR